MDRRESLAGLPWTASPRSVALVLLIAAAFLARPAPAAGQDIYIITTTVTTVPGGGAFGLGGAASAQLMNGSGSVGGDTASTGSSSLMVLTMNDGSGDLSLGSNSSATLDTGGGGDDGGGSPSGPSVSNFRGQGLFNVRPGVPAKFLIPQVLSGGVRGTTFSLEARTGWARVRTYEGTVWLRNETGRIRTVTVREGYETVIRVPSPPTRPKRFRYPDTPFWER